MSDIINIKMTKEGYQNMIDQQVKRGKRDEFAKAALTGWMATYYGAGTFPAEEHHERIAQNIFRLADAMMKARGE